jgi:hypothetical protein
MNRVGARLVTRWPATWMRWAMAWLALTALGACAAQDGGSGGPDAGPSASCWMRVAVIQDVLQAPVGIELAAGIEAVGDEPVGFRSHAWSVWRDDGQIEITQLDASGARIWFLADSPGVYRVSLDGMIGAVECAGEVTSINVSAAGADQQAYRLRVIPRGGQALPVQEIPQLIAVAEEVSLGTLPLAAGVAMTGTVRDGSGAPLAAYVRVMPRGAAVPWFVESFAGADGGFSLQLQNARYDVLVVPLATELAPLVIADQVATPPWQLVIPAAPALAGTIVDGRGEPLAGARISMRTGDAPGALATSDASGAFSVPVRAGSPKTLTVLPAGTGLPWLELSASDALYGNRGPLAIAYAPDLDSVVVAPVARDAGGAPLGGARATWIARPLEGAGQLSAGGEAPIALRGTTRVTATASAGGAFPALELPVAVYDVILEPAQASASAPVTLLSVDLGDGAPASLSSAAPATLTGTVTDAGGAPVAGAEVTASPLGLLAGSPDAGVSAITAADGSFALAVTGGGSYELVLEGRGHGSVRTQREAPASDQVLDLGAIALPAAFLATGRLVLPSTGAGAAGVTVQLLCATCSAPAGEVPVAEAVSDASGDFTLRIPVPATAASSARRD